MDRKKKKEFIPSNNFCILCGRHTNDKIRSVDGWNNQFFACNNCQKVWFGNCMGQVTGKFPGKTLRMGRKGKITCPDCEEMIPMMKLPESLPFTQSKNLTLSTSTGSELSSDKVNFCILCGEKIPQNAQFCHFCGGKQ